MTTFKKTIGATRKHRGDVRPVFVTLEEKVAPSALCHISKPISPFFG